MESERNPLKQSVAPGSVDMCGMDEAANDNKARNIVSRQSLSGDRSVPTYLCMYNDSGDNRR